MLELQDSLWPIAAFTFFRAKATVLAAGNSGFKSRECIFLCKLATLTLWHTELDREDYPERKDPDWLVWTKIKDEKGVMKVWKKQVPKEWQPNLTKPNEEIYYSMQHP